LRLGALDTHVMKLDRHLAHADVQRLAQDIMASDPSVEYAEADRILHPLFTPNDTQYGQQWHYFEATGGLNLPPAWDKSTGSGVAGVAFNAKVVPVRVLGKCGGYTSDIADGIVWASGGSVAGLPANAHPARVINMSLGGSGACDTTSQNAINSARSRSTVVVVAAGNSNANAANFSPASCSGVITV